MGKYLNFDDNLSAKDNFLKGQVILIDKPMEWTSFDVVKKIRNLIRIKKIGHAGTLDPLATGLLILCTGKKTKDIESFMADEKEYKGVMVLGATTPSYDLETEISKEADISHLTNDQIIDTTKQFTGEITQVPPVFSALKIDGQPAYKKARKGEEVTLKSRKVSVRSFEIEKIELPEVYFRVICSKGTYIRSLANDFGEKLKVGAYLKSLQRTRIGTHELKDAYQLDEFISFVKSLA